MPQLQLLQRAGFVVLLFAVVVVVTQCGLYLQKLSNAASRVYPTKLKQPL